MLQSAAMQIMSEILYWYRGSEQLDPDTKLSLGYSCKFHGDMLAYSRRQFSTKLGMSMSAAGRALKWLETNGLIRQELRQVTRGDIILNNVRFIEPIPPAIAKTLIMPSIGDPIKKTASDKKKACKKASNQSTVTPPTPMGATPIGSRHRAKTYTKSTTKIENIPSLPSVPSGSSEDKPNARVRDIPHSYSSKEEKDSAVKKDEPGSTRLITMTRKLSSRQITQNTELGRIAPWLLHSEEGREGICDPCPFEVSSVAEAFWVYRLLAHTDRRTITAREINCLETLLVDPNELLKRLLLVWGAVIDPADEHRTAWRQANKIVDRWDTVCIVSDRIATRTGTSGWLDINATLHRRYLDLALEACKVASTQTALYYLTKVSDRWLIGHTIRHLPAHPGE